MRVAILAACAGLLAASGAPYTSAVDSVRLKDRAALMIYEGRDRVLTVVPYADSANLALIVLQQMEGDIVQPAQLAGRPCVGVALFSKTEWAQLASNGRKPTDVRPGEAAMRMRVYAATKALPAAVQNLPSGTAHVAIGLRMVEKWSVAAYVDSAKGPCTAE